MTPSTIAIITLVTTLAPEVIKYLNLQAMNADITDEQLAILRGNSHDSVQTLVLLLEGSRGV